MTGRMALLRESGRMTATEARVMADEQIAVWRTGAFERRILARMAWAAVQPQQPYPGGGWERVRAEMVRWLLDDYAHADDPVRLAA
jgi:hypothetical protein